MKTITTMLLRPCSLPPQVPTEGGLLIHQVMHGACMGMLVDDCSTYAILTTEKMYVGWGASLRFEKDR